MARAADINKMLGYCGCDHGKRGDHVPCVDALQGCEVKTELANERIDKLVHDWDENYECERIEVIDYIVGDTVEFHCGGL